MKQQIRSIEKNIVCDANMCPPVILKVILSILEKFNTCDTHVSVIFVILLQPSHVFHPRTYKECNKISFFLIKINIKYIYKILHRIFFICFIFNII